VPLQTTNPIVQIIDCDKKDVGFGRGLGGSCESDGQDGHGGEEDRLHAANRKGFLSRLCLSGPLQIDLFFYSYMELQA
jgi:hypothetical protein